jgi:hypothetical protein
MNLLPLDFVSAPSSGPLLWYLAHVGVSDSLTFFFLKKIIINLQLFFCSGGKRCIELFKSL